jgi:tubulin alpha
MVFNAVGGGTGSGFGSLLLERLSTDYKKDTLVFPVYHTSKLGENITAEPYNSVFATRCLMDHADIAIPLDNEAIYDICQHSLFIERPTHTHLNSLIAQLVSSVTAPLRFSGPLNSSVSELRANFVAYNSLHFITAAYAPIKHPERPVGVGSSVDIGIGTSTGSGGVHMGR